MLRRQDSDRAQPTIADECEAFLAGRYAESSLDWSWPVPAWAWVNLLAHSSAEDLRAMAAGRPPARISLPTRRWWEVVSDLAGRVLDEARRTAVAVPELQARALCALESWLLDNEPTAQISVERLNALVLASVYGHPCGPA